MLLVIIIYFWLQCSERVLDQVKPLNQQNEGITPPANTREKLR